MEVSPSNLLLNAVRPEMDTKFCKRSEQFDFSLVSRLYKIAYNITVCIKSHITLQYVAVPYIIDIEKFGIHTTR